MFGIMGVRSRVKCKHGLTVKEQRKSLRGPTIYNKDYQLRLRLKNVMSNRRVKEDTKQNFAKFLSELTWDRANKKPRRFWHQVQLLNNFVEEHVTDGSLAAELKDLRNKMTEEQLQRSAARKEKREDEFWWRMYDKLVKYMPTRKLVDGVFYIPGSDSVEHDALYGWWRQQIGIANGREKQTDPEKIRLLEELGIEFDKERIEEAKKLSDETLTRNVETAGASIDSQRLAKFAMFKNK